MALVTVSIYFLVTNGPSPHFRRVFYLHNKIKNPLIKPGSEPSADAKADWDIDIEDLRYWSDPDDNEDPNDVLQGVEGDGVERDTGDVARLRKEKDLRKMWRYAYKTTANLKSSERIYGNTLEMLVLHDNRTEGFARKLTEVPKSDVPFTGQKPVRFNPYPDYNSDDWKKAGHAAYVPCKGHTGEIVQDLLVFKGRPDEWPSPKFGSYDVLGMDPNICWERETRLGPYGLVEQKKKIDGGYATVDWDNVNWGDLQLRCLGLNSARFDMKRSKTNEYLGAYPETAKLAKPSQQQKQQQQQQQQQQAQTQKTQDQEPQQKELQKQEPQQKDQQQAEKQQQQQGQQGQQQKEQTEGNEAVTASPSTAKIQRRSVEGGETEAVNKVVKEPRTAILLRSYTGIEYTENDMQTIRALITELSLKTGGQYEVFLLVQSKKREDRIFDDPETYRTVLRNNVPAEFHGITVLWNDEQVWSIYTELRDDEERSVHMAQWLSVQKFSHDHPQFDFIWNWEMDVRYIGHHYDLLSKIDEFARKQPRKYLWERNERWYIPEFHGDYDTAFREDVAKRQGNNTVWNPPPLPFIHPVGPKPPVSSHVDDNYEWGVGEDADLITVSPIFNPLNSQWVMGHHIWGYVDDNHKKEDLPRRATIVTQSRLSKRLLDIMHVEEKRGNHVASEMSPQTVALLHGFKAVFAPHPIFMDRDWHGDFVNKWFNPGPNGECGGRGSPMGWGRERRYQGTTWYYRAEPPNRLFNNWMGWPDTGIGGTKWEAHHGRPCLPSIMLHQVKNTEPTDADHASGFNLYFG
ncbi:hypothetical protein DCS_02951 [Drechmeria coniospora]|uniref:Major facilitator superfamily transporter n=1 Tax=Drechmeria coniospora TaxID=98403 RepID=A0A151GXH9_DRECN|nr:hypothetical protein DCS_02951 [Drechmeria coniospora]KYK61807.1 hypothetical protein DCS_02951 [Drechmeria coniospora]